MVIGEKHMPEQKVHQLLLLCLISCAVIMFGLLFLEPILGVLWLLLIVLLCVILSIAKPALWRAEKARWTKICSRIKTRVFSDGRDEEPAEAAVYELAVLKPRTGKRYPINQKTYLIGRASKCDCRLGGSGTLGREHCRIVYREHSKEYYIEDLRSKNGTYLGTRRLEPNTQVKLLENTEIHIGEYCLRFQIRSRDSSV